MNDQELKAELKELRYLPAILVMGAALVFIAWFIH
jgi:hypothetical protein